MVVPPLICKIPFEAVSDAAPEYAPVRLTRIFAALIAPAFTVTLDARLLITTSAPAVIEIAADFSISALVSIWMSPVLVSRF